VVHSSIAECGRQWYCVVLLQATSRVGLLVLVYQSNSIYSWILFFAASTRCIDRTAFSFLMPLFSIKALLNSGLPHSPRGGDSGGSSAQAHLTTGAVLGPFKVRGNKEAGTGPFSVLGGGTIKLELNRFLAQFQGSQCRTVHSQGERKGAWFRNELETVKVLTCGMIRSRSRRRKDKTLYDCGEL
jgi:hypothetical protein